jgi:hypothetical protein
MYEFENGYIWATYLICLPKQVVGWPSSFLKSQTVALKDTQPLLILLYTVYTFLYKSYKFRSDFYLPDFIYASVYIFV